jgi:hypothetical protein
MHGLSIDGLSKLLSNFAIPKCKGRYSGALMQDDFGAKQASTFQGQN